MQNVLARPDFHRGDVARGYWPMPRMADINDPAASMGTTRSTFYAAPRIAARKALGMTDEDIEAEFQEWAKRFY